MAPKSALSWVSFKPAALSVLRRLRVQPGKITAVALATFFLGIAAAGAAETISIIPSADATLFEVNPANSAGGADYFNAGTTQNGTRNRALLQFDVASVIPSGAQITSVDLQVEVLRRPSDGFEVSLFGLHRVLQPWGEGNTIPVGNPGGLGAPAAPGDATWLYRFAFNETWAAPGGAADVDYVNTLSSSAFIYGLGTYHFEGSQDMIGDVQSWLDHPESNFGWMLMCQTEELPFTARRFGSRENPNSAPVLTIEFIPVPEPGTLSLGAIGLGALVLVRGCRKACERV